MKSKQTTPSDFDVAVEAMLQLEPLLKTILPLAKKKKIANGSDLSKIIQTQKIKIPALFQGDKITYEDYQPEFEKTKHKLVILTKPNSNITAVLGIRIGCVTILGRRVCLECGFWYCKIVIYM